MKPLVITGPSGVGKGTLINKLIADFPGRFGFCCSHTTRGPRPGEVDGVHYHFVTKATLMPTMHRQPLLSKTPLIRSLTALT